VETSFSTPAWLPDPTGRHDQRWWTGGGWSGHVGDGGERLFDMAGLPPGWYGGPSDDDGVRFWNGTHWDG